MSAPRDCKHGQLARSCEICSLESELDHLRAVNAELLAALNNAARQLEHIAEALRIDGRNVGAYTKADAVAHLGQVADAARAAIAKAEAKP